MKIREADKKVPTTDVNNDSGKEAKAAKVKNVLSEEEPIPEVKNGNTGVDNGADGSEKLGKAGKRTNLGEGEWRCVVETDSGLVIGEMRFDVVDVDVADEMQGSFLEYAY